VHLLLRARPAHGLCEPYHTSSRDGEGWGACEQMLVGMLLHTADLGNPCMGNKHCKEWEKRISQEFLFQATLEIEQGLPVAPFMLKCDMLSRVENQNHFMTHFAYPQWKAVVEMFPILAPRFNQLVRALSFSSSEWCLCRGMRGHIRPRNGSAR
jgi:hypothetical protein